LPISNYTITEYNEEDNITNKKKLEQPHRKLYLDNLSPNQRINSI